MKRPVFDVVGVFLATAAVTVIALFGTIFIGVKIGLSDRLVSSVALFVVFMTGLMLWRWFLHQHEKALRSYESEKKQRSAKIR
ncbi:hypothetical protein [Hyphococcus sp.]|uniref:hypothetical protein n=1 Tax=Hyphococcus sp. TaxID=2038636 RepID=UPI0035C6FDF3